MLNIVICQVTEVSHWLICHHRKLHTLQCTYGMNRINIKPALMQFDVYSCGAVDDVKEICDKIKEEFNVEEDRI